MRARSRPPELADLADLKPDVDTHVARASLVGGGVPENRSQNRLGR